MPLETAPAFIRLQEIDDFRLNGRLIATSLKLDRAQIVQSIKSLRNIIYLYAFGETLIKCNVGGYLFINNCGQQEGIQILNDFYEQNNIYARTTPLGLTIGQVFFQGFLESMSLAGENNPYNYIAFSFGFSLLPKDAPSA
jgi:hypothetical protein